MEKIFAPGCALMLYKPHLAEAAKQVIEKLIVANLPVHLTCCRHQSHLSSKSEIITVCTSCKVRYKQQYDEKSITTFWEMLSETDDFPFPDYHGMAMSVQDGCLVRSDERIHKSIRKLLLKMNITVIEAEKTCATSICCGDSYYGKLPVAQIKQQMKKRADQMPCDDVVVYCIACLKSMYIGGKKPRYLLDLLFCEETVPQIYEPDEWHNQLNDYIDTQKF